MQGLQSGAGETARWCRRSSSGGRRMGGKGAVRRASNFPQRACTRSAALCARAVCVGKKRRAGQGLAASSGKAKAHRPTHQGCSISRRQRGGKGKICSRGQLSSPIMHSSHIWHSSGPFFSGYWNAKRFDLELGSRNILAPQ